MIMVRVYRGDTPIVNGEIDWAYRNDYFEAMVPEEYPWVPGRIVMDWNGKLYH